MKCFIAKAAAFCFKHTICFDERTNRRDLFTSVVELQETLAEANTRGHTACRRNVPDVSVIRRAFLRDKS